MRNINDMTPLQIELPEDILKAKWCGDFDRAHRLIDCRLADEKVPQCVKERLVLEREILKQLVVEYIYPEEEAFALCMEKFRNFSREEWQALMDRGLIDWIYINGEVYANRKFFDILTVYDEYADRAGIVNDGKNRKVLDENCKEMMETDAAHRHIRVKATFRIKEEAFRKGETVKVHFPLPISAMNQENIKLLSFDPKPSAIGSEDQAQRTVCFEEVLEENRPFTVEFEYDSVVKYVKPDPEQVSPEQPTFDTDELLPHIRFTPFIRALCRELKGEETNPLIVARKFYDYCTKNATYSFVRPYFAITQIPEYCGLNLKGDCGVLALLFITLCRCAGIPARWQSGWYVTPHFCGCHDWAQFYIAPYGWLFADCSFGGSAWRSGNTERHELYFGNLDPFRMAAASEFQAAFVPEKTHLRIDPYDNQRGEAEYPDRGLTCDEVETTWEVLSCEPI